jgi:hypothetical protein
MITKLTIADRTMIRWAVGNVHCCLTDDEMLTKVHAKFDLSPSIISPAALRAFDKAALKAHHDNQKLFNYAMGGLS